MRGWVAPYRKQTGRPSAMLSVGNSASGAQRFFYQGLEVHVRPWRTLRHAFGASLSFRVRLCLESLPVHAWYTEVADKVIGTKCALQCFQDRSTRCEDTRTLDLWAWTANLSSIAKVSWTTFTGRSPVSLRTLKSPAPGLQSRNGDSCGLHRGLHDGTDARHCLDGTIQAIDSWHALEPRRG